MVLAFIKGGNKYFQEMTTTKSERVCTACSLLMLIVLYVHKVHNFIHSQKNSCYYALNILLACKRASLVVTQSLLLVLGLFYFYGVEKDRQVPPNEPGPTRKAREWNSSLSDCHKQEAG